MANKTVSYKNKVISASVVDDFYARLNALRTLDSVATLTVPTTNDTSITTSQIASLYSAVLSTKNAVSFLKNVSLSHSFAGLSAGTTISAPKSVSIIEYNIGQLENACKAFFSTNKSGYKGDSNNGAYFTTHNTTNNNRSTNSAHKAPNCPSHHSSNRAGNAGWCLGFNSGKAYS
jgi:hypothetical protein